MEERKTGYRSLFWPIILIGVGVFWLLGNLNVLPDHSLWTLLRLWPLILVTIGLDILIGRRSPLIGAAIGVGAVTLAVFLVLAAPTLGIVPSGDLVVTESFTEPLAGISSADVELNLSIGKTIVSALSGSANLFDAELTHLGDVEFTVLGDKHKTITLSQKRIRQDFDDFKWFETDELEWDIGLSPTVPISLKIKSSIGQSVLDLTGLLLEKVEIDGDVGDTTLTLPAVENSYAVDIDGGIGKFEVNIEDGAALELTIDGDVGDFTIDVPNNSAVRIEAEMDIGDLNIASRFEKISGGDNDFLSESGIWETPGFTSAKTKIIINFNGGIGSLRVR